MTVTVTGLFLALILKCEWREGRGEMGEGVELDVK